LKPIAFSTTILNFYSCRLWRCANVYSHIYGTQNISKGLSSNAVNLTHDNSSGYLPFLNISSDDDLALLFVTGKGDDEVGFWVAYFVKFSEPINQRRHQRRLQQ